MHWNLFFFIKFELDLISFICKKAIIPWGQLTQHSIEYNYIQDGLVADLGSIKITQLNNAFVVIMSI